MDPIDLTPPTNVAGMAFNPTEPLLSPTIFYDRLRSGFTPAFHGTQQLKVPNGQMSLDLETLARRMVGERRGASTLTTGLRIWELFTGRFAYKEDEEDSWRFHHMLGYGSFGMAAVYRKIDSDGQIVKQMVVKTEQARASAAVNVLRQDISREAFIHAQVNKRNEYANVFLHGYKYHFTDHLLTSTDTQLGGFHDWRYYLEFCQRGTLWNIYMKYRAWGYHLPESFIWWVFYWLVRSCKSLAPQDGHSFLWHGPAAYMAALPGSFVVHNDMSWQNVLFQHEGFNPLQVNFWDRYPVPKMADFGLSEISEKLPNGRNTKKNYSIGTPIFAPPEKRNMETRSDFYPFDEEYPDAKFKFEHRFNGECIKDMHSITPAANLWGAAYLVYLLMTMDDGDDLWHHLTTILEGGFYGQERTWEAGMDSRRLSGGLYLFPHVATNLPEGNRFMDYSYQLCDLVLECTRLQPHNRPSLQEVEQEILAGMNRESQRLQHEFGNDGAAIHAATRVVFDSEEWMTIPKGPFNFVDLERGQRPDRTKASFWDGFRRQFHLNKDPDETNLIPPGPNMAFLPDSQFTPAQADLPFYTGHDRVTYVRERFRESTLHNGNELPYGGRAHREVAAPVAENAKEGELEDPDDSVPMDMDD